MDVGAGTRVLVTGASRGIGEVVARAFASRGCTLGLVARGGEELKRLVAELPGEDHEALTADVADREAMAAAVAAFEPCDVVVANAGIADYGEFATFDLDKAERMTRINWLGTLNTIQPALSGMIERGRGHVVIVSSGQGVRGFPGAPVYGATKAAQRAFGEALRHELAGSGVSLTNVYPGQLATALHDHEKDAMPEWYRAAEGAPVEPIGELVARAVERDQRELFHPSNVRMLRIVHGLSPALADRLLRRLRGASIAPRRG